MRIVAVKTLKQYWADEPFAEQPLKAWIAEIKEANFHNHNELKSQFGSAPIINKKRVVFNIHGNRFRLVVDFEYKYQVVFITWLGTHAEYDKIIVEDVLYHRTY